MSDTIAAIATGSGLSAIGIIRLSGPGAIAALDRVFQPFSGPCMAQRPDRQLVYGRLLDPDGAVLDQCLATVTRGPGSYTGEDTAELQCHGSPVVLSMGLESLFAQGVRQAGPGEFTRRAFVNGRMDLVQAEAVIDLIEAQSRQAARQAAGQLGGALSRRIENIYDTLVDLAAHFDAVLDYPDEDIDPFQAEEIRAALDGACGDLDALTATYRRGRALTEGIPCAIVGRPNAGKSTLFNALLGCERAIVTALPGTTRDTVEERLNFGGVLLRLIDTAGLRHADDEAERLGVARSRAAMERAELILVVADASQRATGEDLELLRTASELAPAILVENKCDLPRRFALPEQAAGLPRVRISARTGQGLDDLRAKIAECFPEGGDADGALLTNARQMEAASRAREALNRASGALEAGMTPDAVLSDVEDAMSALGELTGRSIREDITDRIFSRFCVGK